MDYKFREEVVGKRFLCVSSRYKLKLSAITHWSWQSGVVRAASHKDPKNPELTVLVEFDDRDWSSREWISLYKDGLFCLFVVENTMVWTKRKRNIVLGIATPPNLYWPSLTFIPLVDKVGLSDNRLQPVEYLIDRELWFVDYADVIHYKDADILPVYNDFVYVQNAVKEWNEYQDGQRILVTTPTVLLGYRVEVYRMEGTTQWFSAVIISYNDITQELTLTDDTVLEEHCEDPSLLQMKLLGDGVVDSILRGDAGGIVPRRRTTANTQSTSQSPYTTRNRCQVRVSSTTLYSATRISGVVLRSKRTRSQPASASLSSSQEAERLEAASSATASSNSQEASTPNELATELPNDFVTPISQRGKKKQSAQSKRPVQKKGCRKNTKRKRASTTNTCDTEPVENENSNGQNVNPSDHCNCPSSQSKNKRSKKFRRYGSSRCGSKSRQVEESSTNISTDVEECIITSVPSCSHAEHLNSNKLEGDKVDKKCIVFDKKKFRDRTSNHFEIQNISSSSSYIQTDYVSQSVSNVSIILTPLSPSTVSAAINTKLVPNASAGLAANECNTEVIANKSEKTLKQSKSASELLDENVNKTILNDFEIRLVSGDHASSSAVELGSVSPITHSIRTVEEQELKSSVTYEGTVNIGELGEVVKEDKFESQVVDEAKVEINISSVLLKDFSSVSNCNTLTSKKDASSVENCTSTECNTSIEHCKEILTSTSDILLTETCGTISTEACTTLTSACENTSVTCAILTETVDTSLRETHTALTEKYKTPSEIFRQDYDTLPKENCDKRLTQVNDSHPIEIDSKCTNINLSIIGNSIKSATEVWKEKSKFKTFNSIDHTVDIESNNKLITEQCNIKLSIDFVANTCNKKVIDELKNKSLDDEASFTNVDKSDKKTKLNPKLTSDSRETDSPFLKSKENPLLISSLSIAKSVTKTNATGPSLINSSKDISNFSVSQESVNKNLIGNSDEFVKLPSLNQNTSAVKPNIEASPSKQFSDFSSSTKTEESTKKNYPSENINDESSNILKDCSNNSNYKKGDKEHPFSLQSSSQTIPSVEHQSPELEYHSAVSEQKSQEWKFGSQPVCLPIQDKTFSSLPNSFPEQHGYSLPHPYLPSQNTSFIKPRVHNHPLHAQQSAPLTHTSVQKTQPSLQTAPHPSHLTTDLLPIQTHDSPKPAPTQSSSQKIPSHSLQQALPITKQPQPACDSPLSAHQSLTLLKQQKSQSTDNSVQKTSSQNLINKQSSQSPPEELLQLLDLGDSNKWKTSYLQNLQQYFSQTPGILPAEYLISNYILQQIASNQILPQIAPDQLSPQIAPGDLLQQAEPLRKEHSENSIKEFPSQSSKKVYPPVHLKKVYPPVYTPRSRKIYPERSQKTFPHQPTAGFSSERVSQTFPLNGLQKELLVPQTPKEHTTYSHNEFQLEHRPKEAASKYPQSALALQNFHKRILPEHLNKEYPLEDLSKDFSSEHFTGLSFDCLPKELQPNCLQKDFPPLYFQKKYLPTNQHKKNQSEKQQKKCQLEKLNEGYTLDYLNVSYPFEQSEYPLQQELPSEHIHKEFSPYNPLEKLSEYPHERHSSTQLTRNNVLNLLCEDYSYISSSENLQEKLLEHLLKDNSFDNTEKGFHSGALQKELPSFIEYLSGSAVTQDPHKLSIENQQNIPLLDNLHGKHLPNYLHQGHSLKQSHNQLPSESLQKDFVVQGFSEQLKQDLFQQPHQEFLSKPPYKLSSSKHQHEKALSPDLISEEYESQYSSREFLSRRIQGKLQEHSHNGLSSSLNGKDFPQQLEKDASLVHLHEESSHELSKHPKELLSEDHFEHRVKLSSQLAFPHLYAEAEQGGPSKELPPLHKNLSLVNSKTGGSSACTQKELSFKTSNCESSLTHRKKNSTSEHFNTEQQEQIQKDIPLKHTLKKPLSPQQKRKLPTKFPSASQLPQTRFLKKDSPRQLKAKHHQILPRYSQQSSSKEVYQFSNLQFGNQFVPPSSSSSKELHQISNLQLGNQFPNLEPSSAIKDLTPYLHSSQKLIDNLPQKLPQNLHQIPLAQSLRPQSVLPQGSLPNYESTQQIDLEKSGQHQQPLLPVQVRQQPPTSNNCEIEEIHRIWVNNPQNKTCLHSKRPQNRINAPVLVNFDHKSQPSYEFLRLSLKNISIKSLIEYGECILNVITFFNSNVLSKKESFEEELLKGISQLERISSTILKKLNIKQQHLKNFIDFEKTISTDHSDTDLQIVAVVAPQTDVEKRTSRSKNNAAAENIHVDCLESVSASRDLANSDSDCQIISTIDSYNGLMIPAGISHSAAAAAAAAGVYPNVTSLPQNSRAPGTQIPPSNIGPYSLSPHLLPPPPPHMPNSAGAGQPPLSQSHMEHHAAAMHSQAYRQLMTQHPMLQPQYGGSSGPPVGLDMMWQQKMNPNPYVMYEEMRLERERAVAQEKERVRSDRRSVTKSDREKAEKDRIDFERFQKEQERERIEREERERVQREAVQQHFEESFKLAMQKQQLQKGAAWSPMTSLPLIKQPGIGRSSPTVNVQQAATHGQEHDREKVREKERLKEQDAQLRLEHERWLAAIQRGEQPALAHASHPQNYTVVEGRTTGTHIKDMYPMPRVSPHRGSNPVHLSKSGLSPSPVVSSSNNITSSQHKSETNFSLYGYQPFQHTYITQAQLKAREDSKVSNSLQSVNPANKMLNSVVSGKQEKDMCYDRPLSPGTRSDATVLQSTSSKQMKIIHQVQDRGSPLYQSLGGGGAFKPYEYTNNSPAPPAHQNASSPTLASRIITSQYHQSQEDQPQNLVKVEHKGNSDPTSIHNHQRYESREIRQTSSTPPCSVPSSYTPPYSMSKSVSPASSTNYSYSLIQQGLVPNPLYIAANHGSPSSTSLQQMKSSPRSGSPPVSQHYPRSVPGPGIMSGTPVCRPSSSFAGAQPKSTQSYSPVGNLTGQTSTHSSRAGPQEAHSASRNMPAQVPIHRSPSPAHTFGPPFTSNVQHTTLGSPQSSRSLSSSPMTNTATMVQNRHRNVLPANVNGVTISPPLVASPDDQLTPLNLHGMCNRSKRKSNDPGNRKRQKVEEHLVPPQLHPQTHHISDTSAHQMNTPPHLSINPAMVSGHQQHIGTVMPISVLDDRQTLLKAETNTPPLSMPNLVCTGNEQLPSSISSSAFNQTHFPKQRTIFESPSSQPSEVKKEMSNFEISETSSKSSSNFNPVTPVIHSTNTTNEGNEENRFAASPASSASSTLTSSSSTCSSNSYHTKLKKAWLQRHSENEDKKLFVDSLKVELPSKSNVSTADELKDSAAVAKSSLDSVESNVSDDCVIYSQDGTSCATDLPPEEGSTSSASEIEEETRHVKRKLRINRKSGSSLSGGKKQKSSSTPTESQSEESQLFKKDSTRKKPSAPEKELVITKRRGRKTKGRNTSADEAKKKTPKPLEKLSVAQLKKTGEAFLQDGPCCEVAPRLPKCRECRMTANQRNKKMPNIFCRFYAYRKLRYGKNGTISGAGFSEPSDATEEDLKLWLPPLDNPPSDIEVETSKFLLTHIGDQFCDLVEMEREAQAMHMSESATITWKRVVQGVREMCDVCETTLFNFHWVCHKCGFVVCIDCYKTRKSGSEKGDDSLSKDRDQFQWLLCTSRQAHEIEKLMLTQIIANTALWDVGKTLHEVRRVWNIPTYCSCAAKEGEDGKHSTNGICKLMSAVTKCFSSDKDSSQVNGITESSRSSKKSSKSSSVNGVKQDDGISGYSSESGGSPLSWLADVALNSSSKAKDESLKLKTEECDESKLSDNQQDNADQGESDDERGENFSTLRELLIRPMGKMGTKNCGDSSSQKTLTSTLDEVISCVIEQRVRISDNKCNEKELFHFTRRHPLLRSGRELLPIRSCMMTESSLLYPDIPHVWLGNGKILLLTDPVHSGNMQMFQEQWKRGQPVIVSNVGQRLDQALWTPESFIQDFGELRNDLLNCSNGAILVNQPLKKFWEGFENSSKRMKDEAGYAMILKLKDWPSGEEFSDVMPSRYQDLLKVLPLSQYTHRDSIFNMASRLPECFVRSDLGPRMSNAYGRSRSNGKSSSNLHLDVSDAVNILMYVGNCADGNDYSFSDIRQSLEESGCDSSMKTRGMEDAKHIGAIWHIFNARDADKIRDLLNKVSEEQGNKRGPHHDPIHNQEWYLDEKLRNRLLEEYNVEGYSIAQCYGDAIFIPAGSPRQVCNLKSCINVSLEFVSPESVGHSFFLTQELRNACDGPLNQEDKLQIKNIIYHSVKDALALLQSNNPEDSKS